jgi:hypothetical protein
MYQWKEEKKEDTQTNVGGGTTTTTTYDYTRVWSNKPINSSEFKHPENHDNPEMPFRNAQFTASDAKLGDWPLDADVLGRLTLTQALMLLQAGREAVRIFTAAIRRHQRSETCVCAMSARRRAARSRC